MRHALRARRPVRLPRPCITRHCNMPRLCRKCRHRGSAHQHRADTAAAHPASCGTPSDRQEFATRRASFFCPRVKRQSCSVDAFLPSVGAKSRSVGAACSAAEATDSARDAFFAHRAESRMATSMLFCSMSGQKARVPGLSAPAPECGRATPKLFHPNPRQKHWRVVCCAPRKRPWEWPLPTAQRSTLPGSFRLRARRGRCCSRSGKWMRGIQNGGERSGLNKDEGYLAPTRVRPDQNYFTQWPYRDPAAFVTQPNYRRTIGFRKASRRRRRPSACLGTA